MLILHGGSACEKPAPAPAQEQEDREECDGYEGTPERANEALSVRHQCQALNGVNLLDGAAGLEIARLDWIGRDKYDYIMDSPKLPSAMPTEFIP